MLVDAESPPMKTASESQLILPATGSMSTKRSGGVPSEKRSKPTSAIAGTKRLMAIR